MRARAARLARRCARRSGRHHGAIIGASCCLVGGACRFPRCSQADRNPPNPDLLSRDTRPMKINAIDLKPGNVLEHQNKLWIVLKRELGQPGKGGSFAQDDLRDLRGGTKINERFRPQEAVERVWLAEKDMQFLYMEGNQAAFMANNIFEQVTV